MAHQAVSITVLYADIEFKNVLSDVYTFNSHKFVPVVENGSLFVYRCEFGVTIIDERLLMKHYAPGMWRSFEYDYGPEI